MEESQGDSRDDNKDFLQYPSYFLDLGSSQDTNQSQPIFLVGIWPQGVENQITYRNLTEQGTLYFSVNTSELELSSEGVPYKDAIITIRYKDVIDETNCNVYSAYIAYCRPRFHTMLNYAGLDYFPIASLGGINDRQWKETKLFLDSNHWQMLRSINNKMNFNIWYPKQLSSASPFPIDSVNISFVDHDTFLQAREQERLNKGFVKIEYSEENTLQSEFYPKGYVVYTRNYLEKIYPNTIPSLDEINQPLYTFEISGELEPLTFAIFSFKKITNVTIDVSDLVGAKGEINSENIEINKVAVLDKRWGSFYEEHYGKNPWYLEPTNTIDVNENESQQLWLTIQVPKGTPQGAYYGNVTISGAEIQQTTIPLILDVYSIDLLDSETPSILYGSPYDREYSDPAEVAALDMAAHNQLPLVHFNPKITGPPFVVNFSSDAEEFANLSRLGLLGNKTRIGMSDPWRWLWEHTQGGTNYFIGDSSQFDAAYLNVLGQYRNWFLSNYNFTPALSFEDEPGDQISKRRSATHLNRLAQQAGFKTWVTYYPTCEKPLAGYFFSFHDPTVPMPRNQTPSELNPYLVAHWSFEGNYEDSSENHFDGTPFGDATIQDGHLLLSGSGFVGGQYSPAMNLTNASFGAWVRLDSQLPGFIFSLDKSLFAYRHFSNYYDFIYTNNLSDTSMGIQSVIKPSTWTHVGFVFNGTDKLIYMNGQLMAKEPATGKLATTSFSDWEIGVSESRSYDYWHGLIDEVALFNRSLSDAEMKALTVESGTWNIQEGQQANMTLHFNKNDAPTHFALSFQDPTNQYEDVVAKSIYLNGEKIWEKKALDYQYQTFDVDLSEYLTDGTNTIVVSLDADRARNLNFTVYFLDDFWRNSVWTITTNSALWSYQNISDQHGDLAPMDRNLDQRVYSLSYLTSEEIQKTSNSRDTLAYYTTGPATMPVITYNRFLNGLYASAVGADSVFAYAYGDWAFPYDEITASWIERSYSPTSRRGQVNYELTLPSWEEKMYDAVIFESMREGVEDSRILATLKREIQNHPGQTAIEAADYVSSLSEKVSKNYDTRYGYTANLDPIETYNDRSAEILTDIGGNASDYYAFDKIRKQMINYIIELQEGACGDGICSEEENEISCSADCGFIQFKIKYEDGTEKVYTNSTGQTENKVFQYLDEDIDAKINVSQKIKILTLSPLQKNISKVWFPWEYQTHLDEDENDDFILYPHWMGIAIKIQNVSETAWSGDKTRPTYPGDIFSPILIRTDEDNALTVASASWPPVSASPLYKKNDFAIEYDKKIPVNSSENFSTFIFQTTSQEPGVQPWQKAADEYKKWLREQLYSENIWPVKYPESVQNANGWIHYNLNLNPRDPTADPHREDMAFNETLLQEKYDRWKSVFPWIQFWGQMSPWSNYYNQSATPNSGCCLRNRTINERYLPFLTSFMSQVKTEGGQVSLYQRPYRPTEGSPYYLLNETFTFVTPDLGTSETPLQWFQNWIRRNTEFGSNAYYLDVLGAVYLGEPELMMNLFDDTKSVYTVPPESVIEFPVDIYPTSFLTGTSFSGLVDPQKGPLGGPGIKKENFNQTVFPQLARYILDDRIFFIGESNYDHYLWGTVKEYVGLNRGFVYPVYQQFCNQNPDQCWYWMERQAFLMGGKFDAWHIEENQSAPNVLDKIINLTVAEWEKTNWNERQPRYYDTKGISEISNETITIKRFVDKEDKHLFVIDNPLKKSPVQFLFYGDPVIIDIPINPSTSQPNEIYIYESSQAPANCVPEWQVFEWTLCENKLQTRIVIDINGCGRIDDKPATMQTCDESTSDENKNPGSSSGGSGTATPPSTPQICTPNWVCTWSSCIENIQHGQCVDNNHCNNTNYSTQRTCSNENISEGQCIDNDQDMYGSGSGCLGPDSDDSNPAIHETPKINSQRSIYTNKLVFVFTALVILISVIFLLKKIYSSGDLDKKARAIVKEAQSRNLSEEEIRALFEKNGWRKKDIDKLLE